MRTIKEEGVDLSEYQDFADAYRGWGGSSTTGTELSSRFVGLEADRERPGG